MNSMKRVRNHNARLVLFSAFCMKCINFIQHFYALFLHVDDAKIKLTKIHDKFPFVQRNNNYDSDVSYAMILIAILCFYEHLYLIRLLKWNCLLTIAICKDNLNRKEGKWFKICRHWWVLIIMVQVSNEYD